MGRGKGKKNAKQKIVEAAWQLFYEKGFSGTTVDDIIELSDTSKGSFYYYFNTKDELLNTLSIMLDDQYELLEAGMDPEMNSYEKLLYLNHEIHKWMEENVHIELLTSLYSTQLAASGKSCLLNHNRVYFRLITKIVDEGQLRGQIKQDAPVMEIVKYYAMCERALVSDWCLSRGEYSLVETNTKYMAYMMEHYRA